MSEKWNHRGYIATITSTSLSPVQGLRELLYLASICDDDRRVRIKKKATAAALSEKLHIGRDTAKEHLDALSELGLLKKITIKRQSFYELAPESALEKLA